MATYTVELWSSSGHRLADISALAMNKHYEIWRNNAEALSFDLDLNQFEAFAKSAGSHPRELLTPYQTDVKVLRNGAYLFGTQVIAASITVNNNQMVIKVLATGYLDLFKNRYLTYTYTRQDRGFIAGDIITQVQAVTNGGMGVTLGSLYLTGVLRDRTYEDTNAKTALQNLARLSDAPFDFAFDSNKVFTTYQQIGSVRTDVAYVFGGDGTNIIELYDENSATNLYNHIKAYGSGFGPDKIVSTQDDVSSQIGNYMREDIKQYNSVTEQATLDQHAISDLALEKSLLEIPQVTINGNDIPNPFFTIGDRIPLRMFGHPYLDPLTGIFRLEKMAVDIDSNDFETGQLYFDNFDLDLVDGSVS